jgi:hypothetical protein
MLSISGPVILVQLEMAQLIAVRRKENFQRTFRVVPGSKRAPRRVTVRKMYEHALGKLSLPSRFIIEIGHLPVSPVQPIEKFSLALGGQSNPARWYRTTCGLGKLGHIRGPLAAMAKSNAVGKGNGLLVAARAMYARGAAAIHFESGLL